MLAAGLTVQQYMETEDTRTLYCPGYIAMATNDQSPLDLQLQMAGRSFVDMRDIAVPQDWKIQMLGVQGIVERLLSYSEMEKKLARVGKKTEQIDETDETTPQLERGKKL